MKNVPAGTDDNFGAIVSDLFSLVEHVRASIDLIDGAIAREISLGDGEAANVIVLDDVTPQYLKASQALQACGASLDLALRSLVATRPPAQAANRLAARRCIANGFCRSAKHASIRPDAQPARLDPSPHREIGRGIEHQ
jgi:hypothetical protein